MSASIQLGSYYISLFFFPRAPHHNHSHRSTPLSYNLPSYVAVAVSTLSYTGRTASLYLTVGLRLLPLIASLFTNVQFTEVVHYHVIIANVL
jgi:hypothetical protein